MTINLTGSPYVAPQDPHQVVFAFAPEGSVVEPPEPLAIMASARHGNRAALPRSGLRRHYIKGTQDHPFQSHRQPTDQADTPLSASQDQHWDRITPQDGRGTIAWDALEPRAITREHDHQAPPPKDIQRDHAWDGLDFRALTRDHDHRVPATKDIEHESPHRSTLLYHADQEQPTRTYDPTGYLALTEAPYTAPGALVVDFDLIPQADLVRHPTRVVDAHSAIHAWAVGLGISLQIWHPWDAVVARYAWARLVHKADPDPIDPDPTDPPDAPPNRRSIFYMNSSSLVTLPGLVPLDFSDITISLDIDSFSWVMTCTLLNEASLELVKPTASGPAEVMATINGHQWVFIVERYGIDRKFAKERFTISCVGRTQLLGKPYAPVYSGSNASPQTISQAMNSRLDLTGFSVDYPQGLPDPTLPGGAYEYADRTPVEIVADLAKSIGAAIIPSPNTDTLRIRHRYKMIGPWAYPAQAENVLDAILADSVILGYSSEWNPGQEYNGVHVSGLTKGIACTVIRQGTAGDQEAPDDFSDLTVDPEQARLKGLALLAASGNYEIVTIETPLPTSGAPGLLEPGMLVEYRHARYPAQNWRGIVLENRISVSQPGSGRVIQSIKIERHHYEA